ncbi:MAG: hypothetical protein WCS85_01710 [Candidatus Peribacteraceae bacterium]|jgi:hypothetical protein
MSKKRIWPRWLNILTTVFVLVWILALLPGFLGLANCTQTGLEGGQTCLLITGIIAIAACETGLLLFLGWSVFYICAFSPHLRDTWRHWLNVGLMSAATLAVIGGILFLPFYTTDMYGSGDIPPGALSLPFVRIVLLLFGYGFLLALFASFPLTRALALRRSHLRPATKGFYLGGAIGIVWSVLSLAVVPFVSVFLLAMNGMENAASFLLGLLSLLRPLVLFFLPASLIENTPFSTSFDPLGSPFSQALSLPLFILFHSVANILILAIVGAAIGWIVGRSRRKK